jgi:peptidoglycan hydrolase-like protein with peptidoglycan-binding domain
MRKSALVGAGLIFSVGMMPADPVRANDLAAGIIGALIIGGAINAHQRERQRAAAAAAQRRPTQPRQDGAQVAAAKELQGALNHFGYDAGPVDGAPGRRTKAAVAVYQGSLGHPQTGEITAVEQQLLLDSMARERMNPAEAMQIAATNPYGRRGLPAAYRQMAMPAMAAAPMAPPAGQNPGVAAQQGAVPEVARAPGQAIMPTFGVPTEPVRSINAHCNRTTALTTTNGGFASVNAMPDPALALNEQFCLARTFAMAEGQKVAASVGATQEQITSQCGMLKAQLEPKLAGYGAKTPETVAQEVRAVFVAAGAPMEQMQVTGRVCLAEGYRTDDPAMAVISAATLAAADLRPYSELLGHHLREGFGTPANPSAAKVWVRDAMDRIQAGAAPVFLPGQAAERGAILSKALAAS